VRLVGAEPSGLAEMLAGLIERRLERDPEAAARLRPTVVVLTATDAEVVVTVRLGRREVVVRDGDAPTAHLRIATTAAGLLTVASTPLRGGVPDPTTSAGRAALADVVRGRVRIHGLVAHPLRLRRVLGLLSVGRPEPSR
jgi:hypothetical protein